MGQVQSSIQTESPPVDSRKEITQKKSVDEPTKLVLRKEPLEAWTNDDRYSFEIISPSSDISNPSQFRHRLPSKAAGGRFCHSDAKHRNIRTKARVQTNRNRTSKVCLKQQPHTSLNGKATNDTIPPPTRFYFQEESDESKLDADGIRRQVSVDENEVDDVQLNDRHKCNEAIHTWKLKCLIWKMKCQRAKQNLVECWPTDEDNGKGVKIQRTFDQRDSLSTVKNSCEPSKFVNKSTTREDHPNKYLQLEPSTFQPVWKEQSVDAPKSNVVVNEKNEDQAQNIIASPYYFHNEGAYVMRIAVQNPMSHAKDDVGNILPTCDEFNAKDNDNLETPVQALFDADNGMPFTFPENRKGGTTIDIREGYGTIDVKPQIQSESENDPAPALLDMNKPTMSFDCKELGISNELKKGKVVSPDEKTEKHISFRVSIQEDIQRQIDAQLLQQLSSESNEYNQSNVRENEESSRNQSSTASRGYNISMTKPRDPETEKRSNKRASDTQSKLQGASINLNENFQGLNKPMEDSTPDTNNQVKRIGVGTKSLTKYSSHGRNSSASIASMLQQTYITKYLGSGESSEDDSCDDDRQREITKVKQSSIAASRHQEHQLISYPFSPKSYAVENLQVSPAASACSMNSTSSKPILSDQAISNAAFLFSPSLIGGGILKRRASTSSMPAFESSGISISTFGSRSRLSLQRLKPITIPVKSPTSIDDSKQANRRVRFSSGEKVLSLLTTTNVSSVPAIENKLSDLTENSGAIRNMPKYSKYELQSIARVSHEFEETSEREESGVQLSQPPEASQENLQQSELSDRKGTPETTQLDLLTSFDENILVFEDHIENAECTPPGSHKMRWSYRRENGMVVGVTPLLKSTATAHTTNSPYLRFQAAKSIFCGNFVDKTRHSKDSVMAENNDYPLTKGSSIHQISSSTVNTRIAAMEAQGLPNTKDYQTHNRNDLVNDKLMSKMHRNNMYHPMELRPDQEKDTPYDEENDLKKENAFSDSSNEGRSSGVLKTPETIFRRAKQEVQSGNPNGNDYEQNFGQLIENLPYDEGANIARTENLLSKLHASQVSKNKLDNESEADAFDELLNEDESDTESTIEYGSVATIRQKEQGSLGSYYLARRRSSVGDSSTLFTGTTQSPDNGSVATIRQWRDSLISIGDRSVSSGVSQMQYAAISFRSEAHVNPPELSSVVQPGPLPVSSTENTTLHARKWRALAAAAHEKDNQRSAGKANNSNIDGRKSLSERNPNTFGR